MSVDRSPSTHRLSRLAGPTALAVSLVLLVHTMSVNASRPANVKADPTPVAVVCMSRAMGLEFPDGQARDQPPSNASAPTHPPCSRLPPTAAVLFQASAPPRSRS